MKTLCGGILLTLIIGTIGAADTDSFRFIDHLLQVQAPDKPYVLEDAVIFTAPSSYRRVGVAFAHEGFSKVYWFRKLMVSNENSGPWIKEKPPADLYRDSGILFYIYRVPEELRGDLEYRLVIDGLWVRDPLNPHYRRDPNSGIVRSVVALPPIKRPDSPNRGPPGALTFTFYAETGETVTVAGSFNRWDPFMYELREVSPGRYTLSLPLPPGTYQYVFFYRGERRLDPNNPRRIYTREGKAANEASVE
ncbi:MAG: glycogen-binding domain-containing protein [Spirochaetaceae bacterium]|jgi:hypothetical protein|nr:glycogen-binding domain-containing protein [Spirochaetaceae bacterium]